MSKLITFLKCLAGLQSAAVIRRQSDPPRDLVEFTAAKKRLRKSSRRFMREIDEFGSLVYGMRDVPVKQPPKKKKGVKRR